MLCPNGTVELMTYNNIRRLECNVIVDYRDSDPDLDPDFSIGQKSGIHSEWVSSIQSESLTVLY